ncbi:MAG: hypothetical protein ACYDB4_02925 [Candidatus Dormibacteraceae bacterium]
MVFELGKRSVSRMRTEPPPPKAAIGGEAAIARPVSDMFSQVNASFIQQLLSAPGDPAMLRVVASNAQPPSHAGAVVREDSPAARVPRSGEPMEINLPSDIIVLTPEIQPEGALCGPCGSLHGPRQDRRRTAVARRSRAREVRRHRAEVDWPPEGVHRVEQRLQALPRRDGLPPATLAPSSSSNRLTRGPGS